MNKCDVFVSQLEKYAKLKEGEKVVKMAEELLKYERINTSDFEWYKGRKIKDLDRILKVMKLKWTRHLSDIREVNLYQAKSIELTLDDMRNLAKIYEQYRNIFSNALYGGPTGYISFDRSEVIDDVLFDVVFNEDERLEETIEACRRGFVPKNISYERGKYSCHQLLTLKEVGNKIVVKEIYFPYSGIVLSLTEE
jgi:hypothetical protein